MWHRVNALRDAKATSRMFICDDVINTTIRRTAAPLPIRHSKRKRGHSRIGDAERFMTEPRVCQSEV